MGSTFYILAAMRERAALGGAKPAALLMGARPATFLAQFGAAFLPLLADIPSPPAGSFEPWLLNATMWIAILVLVMHGIGLGQKLFGRRPPLHVELEAVDARYTELEKRLCQMIGACLTLQFFEEYKKERAEDIRALKDAIAGVGKELKEQGSANYRGRKTLHKQVNAHENALSYISAVIDRGGAEVRKRLAQGQANDEEDAS